jgi:hypothetical protein
MNALKGFSKAVQSLAVFPSACLALDLPGFREESGR